jgi:hypothetical protein
MLLWVAERPRSKDLWSQLGKTTSFCLCSGQMLALSFTRSRCSGCTKTSVLQISEELQWVVSEDVEEVDVNSSTGYSTVPPSSLKSSPHLEMVDIIPLNHHHHYHIPPLLWIRSLLSHGCCLFPFSFASFLDPSWHSPIALPRNYTKSRYS